MSGIVAAYQEFGACLKNPNWSWSAISPKGEVIVTLWQDEFDYKATPPCYDLFGHPLLNSWTGRNGNKDRIEHLKYARDHNEGLFNVVITIAEDTKADPRKIKEAFAKRNMRLRLTDLNEATGEFRAVLI
jgi:hypothetical protein